jgi:hypothetical protein
MLARGDKDEEFGTDDDDFTSIMNSNEDISQRSIASNAISPREDFSSTLTSPSTNLDQELENLLLEEAKKQGIYDVDAVNLFFSIFIF